eukprot:CAMPEP_0201475812 /NCGR_PEP_ID=MMETSP0151_2-20130828/1166_1 /ASSEMBLY_ACC=CAM_ASM_000257 /TAXON_ID=200890 /ORGANISM="Paramoeba atlantica, Strain 621/1 / CCAP 1560/9" /LENGTH=222 /DNA_ID=CAMNT_0047856009 /DNA_START=1003 /DNA_END=1671 /DNA_ORIENTATION=+
MARVQSTSSSWDGHFKEDDHISGSGVGGEGVVKGVRFHSVQCSKDVTRFIALNIQVSLVYQKKFDKDGLEDKPRIAGINDLRKTYPNYQPKHKNDPHPVSPDDLVNVIGKDGHPISKELYGESLQSLHPHKPKIFEFWGDNNKLKSLNLEVGDEVIFTTKGDSIFLETCHRSKGGAFGNYSENEKEVLGGWAAKVNKVGEAVSAEPLPWEQNEGVDESEWSD